MFNIYFNLGFIFSFVFSLSVFAQDVSPFMEYVLPEDKASQVESEIFKHYSCPQNTYVCKALDENLNRDSNGCRVAPRSISALGKYWEQNNHQRHLVSQGRIRYFGPITGNYFYDLDRLSDGRIKITAKMHFKNLNQYTKQEIQSYQRKFKQAADIWNRYNPYPQLYIFDFNLSFKESPRTVSARLIRPKTRGPYFQQWSLTWTKYTIAHEFGHVMGLFDEYDYINPENSQCDSSSLMCSSYYGNPLDYHYHLILQRPFCEV